MTIPIMTINGNSQYEPSSSAGTTKAGVFPKTAQFTVVALTAARITGVKPVMVYSIMMTSMEKITPASGVLNEAAMAAAAPQATSTRMLLFGIRNFCPSKLAVAAPR